MKEKNSETTTVKKDNIPKVKSPKQIRESSKLTTSKLALKLGLKTNELNRKFVQIGYLEKKGKNFDLTKKGKLAGGVWKSNGTRGYILWEENTL